MIICVICLKNFPYPLNSFMHGSLSLALTSPLCVFGVYTLCIPAPIPKYVNYFTVRCV